LRIISKVGREDIAMVYVCEFDQGKYVEFVESVQPPIPRNKKWVIIISTLFGCPVGCRLCDAGGDFHGKLSTEEMISQIDHIVTARFPDRKIPVEKFKIQFARMGEPAYNRNVITLLETIPDIYDAPGFVPSISTIAPKGTDGFFQELLKLKKEKYKNRFQFQFSIHTTDEKLRDWLMPVPKWNFQEIAEYGKRFYDNNGAKITLNFSLTEKMPVDPNILAGYFPPEIFLIKLTPVNPTYQAKRNELYSPLDPGSWKRTVGKLESKGYEVIESIGELEENFIGSNCGQYILMHNQAKKNIEDAYTYDPQDLVNTNM